MNKETIEIKSRDYWFKVTGMSQQNWALLDQIPDDDAEVIIYFIGDTSGVFDRMLFQSLRDAESGLFRNGFARFSEDKSAQEFIAIPDPPFWESKHPNGPIYSSGRYWK